ncbi:MAG: carboxypeptidase-like regulatory domain-containing protein [Bacteroidetes bacterium]|nr:carboxypeptidase-like regulatory domain-containing protein [Bacteroidota bacterium]
MNKKILLHTFFALLSVCLFAQDITISGNIKDEKKRPMPGANVLVKGTAIGTTTDDAGNYTLKVPQESKTLVVSYLGYDNREFAIKTNEGNYVLNVDLATTDVGLNQVVVSASKKKEKILDAPASISVIGQEKLERNIVTTPVEQLKTTPGVDIMRTGLVSSNVVVRGFNNIFSGSVLNVVDNRIGSVPSLRINAYQLVPTSNLDMERIEVVRGPASALYGPNASSGVVHIITKSPLDQEKKFMTTIAMTSGFTVLDKSLTQYNNGKTISGNIINPEFRHSGKLLDGKFGYKISGSYFQGQDYPVIDPREPFEGDSMLFGSVHYGKVFTPDTIQKFTHDSAGITYLDSAHLDIRRFKKDFFIRKYAAEGRIDIRPIKDLTITVNGGLSGTHNIELTGLGAAQGGGVGRGWIYWYLQTRISWKKLYIQYFINSSDAGNTYLIPNPVDRASYDNTSPPSPYKVQFLTDKSKLHGVQIQHSWNPIENLGLIYGLDALMTRPDTKGTINGRFEDKDNLNQVGGYLQGDYEPLKWLKFVAAFRIDWNSILKGVSFSPRAAVVIKPAVGHNIRLTYNRAFDSPTTLNQFLDLSNGLIPNGINVRGIGNPNGWNYNFDGAGTVQFNAAPWTGSNQVERWHTFGDKSFNVQAFDSFTTFLRKGFTDKVGSFLADVLVNGIFAGIGGDTGTVANATHISVAYDKFAQQKELVGSIQNTSSFKNLAKIGNSTTQTLELGYKGLIAGKLSLQIDAYWTRISNYVSALKSASGAVMLDSKSYLGYDEYNKVIDQDGRLWKNLHNADNTPNVLNQLLQGSLDGQLALQNDKIIQHRDTDVYDEIIVMTYTFPLGTITPNDPAYVNSDYILTYQNLGRLDVFGIDFGFQYNAIDDAQHSIILGGSMSWVNKDQLILSTLEAVPLNAPKLKAAVTFDHTLKKSGLGYGINFRYQMGYDANSSIYAGPVKPAYILDARVSYRPTFYKGLLLSINVNNVTNYQWQSFPGAATMGAQFFAKAQVTF